MTASVSFDVSQQEQSSGGCKTAMLVLHSECRALRARAAHLSKQSTRLRDRKEQLASGPYTPDNQSATGAAPRLC